MKDFVQGSAKAVYAALVAALTAAIANASNGFTVVEWLGTLLAAVTAFGGVYWVENKGPKASIGKTKQPVPDPDLNEDVPRLPGDW